MARGDFRRKLKKDREAARRRHPSYVEIDSELLAAIITALEPEKADLAAWELQMMGLPETHATDQ